MAGGLSEYLLDEGCKVPSPYLPFVGSGILLPYHALVSLVLQLALEFEHAVDAVVLFTTREIDDIEAVELLRVRVHAGDKRLGIERLATDGGSSDQAGREDADIGESVHVAESDEERLSASHRETRHGSALAVTDDIVVLLDIRKDIRYQRRIVVKSGSILADIRADASINC